MIRFFDFTGQVDHVHVAVAEIIAGEHEAAAIGAEPGMDVGLLDVGRTAMATEHAWRGEAVARQASLHPPRIFICYCLEGGRAIIR